MGSSQVVGCRTCSKPAAIVQSSGSAGLGYSGESAGSRCRCAPVRTWQAASGPAAPGGASSAGSVTSQMPGTAIGQRVWKRQPVGGSRGLGISPCDEQDARRLGARALVLSAGCEQGPPEAFLTGREFAHLHPEPDQSLHLALPTRDAQRAIDLGWAEWHLHALAGRWPRTIGIVFAPRDLREVDAVELLVRRSCWFASGITMQPGTVPGGRSGDDDWR
jgi:hypothetical protein